MRLEKVFAGAFAAVVVVLAVSVSDVRQAVAQAVKEMIIVNTPAQPVWTRDLDAPARQDPYNFSFTVPIPAGQPNGDAVLAIVQPAQQLIIEHLSVDADVGANDQATAVVMGLAGGQLLWQHALPMTRQGDFVVGDYARFAASQPMRVHVKGRAQGDTQVVVRMLRGDPSGGPAGFTASVSGYRIN